MRGCSSIGPSAAHGIGGSPRRPSPLRFPARSSGEARSKRIASDALDRLRAAGLIDWQHGTKEEFYDKERRSLLNGRWQGPSTYRLTIPVALHQMIVAREGAARSETMRTKRQHNGGRTGRHDTPADARGISAREERRRQVQSVAASTALAASTTTFDEGVTALHDQYGADDEVFAWALEQFEQSWNRGRGRARGPT